MYAVGKRTYESKRVTYHVLQGMKMFYPGLPDLYFLEDYENLDELEGGFWFYSNTIYSTIIECQAKAIVKNLKVNRQNSRVISSVIIYE